MMSYKISLLLLCILADVLIARPHTAASDAAPLRAKIISQRGKVQLWSKTNREMDTLHSSLQIQSSRTLILPENTSLHLTFEPLIELIVTGPATLSLNNLAIERSNGTIRMLLAMEKGTLSVKAPPQSGHLLLFSLKTPSALLNASILQMNVTVDTLGVTTTDVIRGSTKIIPGNGKLSTTLKREQRCTASPDNANVRCTKLPKTTSSLKMMQAVKKQPKIGILSMRSVTKNQENLEPVSNSIAQEFEKATDAKILFLDDIRKLLHTEGNDRLLSCHSDSCISQIGNSAGVDVVIVGQMSQLGTTHILDLKMIDVLRDRILSRATVSVEEDIGKILSEIPKVISKLSVTDTILTSVVALPVSTTPVQSTQKFQETLIWIFPGSFIMGSQSKTGDIDELPTHTVDLDGFYIDRFEVTRDEFTNVMGFNPVPSHGCGNCPVTNITWKEASDYCAKLGKRLPTEAEWEYACRAKTTSTFHTGVTISSDQANFNAQKPYGGSSIGKFIGRVVPVGNYPPNSWNLHDMYGNAAEWCSDWYDVSYYGNSSKKNPGGPEKGKLKVVRGGSWNSAGKDIRSANRLAYNPELRLNTIGFRCVKPDRGEPEKEK